MRRILCTVVHFGAPRFGTFRSRALRAAAGQRRRGSPGADRAALGGRDCTVRVGNLIRIQKLTDNAGLDGEVRP